MLDESMMWIAPDMAETFCRRIAAAGFNVVVPCVWHGRGTLWPSKLAPWDNHPIARKHYRRGYDPLAALIAAARKYQLEVHPWFTVSLRQRDFFSQFANVGAPEKTFDIHNEGFQEFISELMLEVVRNYPLDGIYFDYTRSGSKFWKNARWRELYQRQTGRDLAIDYQLRFHDGIGRWHEQAAGAIVRRVSLAARKINPRIVRTVYAPLGASSIVQGRNAPKWLAEGWIDVIQAADYTAQPDWDKYRTFQAQLSHPGALVVLCGNYDRVAPGPITPRAGPDVANLLNRSRTINSANGVSLYLYSQFTDDQLRALSETTFRAPARPQWQRV